jgi:predicted ATPase
MVVISGSLGGGKSSLLAEFGRCGYAVVQTIVKTVGGLWAHTVDFQTANNRQLKT